MEANPKVNPPKSKLRYMNILSLKMRDSQKHLYHSKRTLAAHSFVCILLMALGMLSEFNKLTTQPALLQTDNLFSK